MLRIKEKEIWHLPNQSVAQEFEHINASALSPKRFLHGVNHELKIVGLADNL